MIKPIYIAISFKVKCFSKACYENCNLLLFPFMIIFSVTRKVQSLYKLSSRWQHLVNIHTLKKSQRISRQKNLGLNFKHTCANIRKPTFYFSSYFLFFKKGTFLDEYLFSLPVISLTFYLRVT